MDSETLERLMLDRALGALPADCEALLVAYLESHPEAASACREIEQAVGLARRALAEEPTKPLPAFPADRLLRSGRSFRLWRTARVAAAVAASIAIGFGAHVWLSRASTTGSGRPPAPMVAYSGSEQVSEDGREGAAFWSGRRLYERAAGTQRQSSNRLIWDSPLRTPRKGDAT